MRDAAGDASPAVGLRLRRVTYADGTVAVRDVALEAAPGEIVAVLGHVGAGKSTVALAAAGLLGRAVPARVEGVVRHPLGGDPPAAFVFANPVTQLTELGGTVREEVAVGPENQRLAPPAIAARVDAALHTAGAASLAHRAPSELSGGELQRVALAAALALDAPLLVLDEPTAQLDPAASARLGAVLRDLAGSGRAVLLVEQDLALVRAIAHRVVLLADGHPVAAGAPDALLDRWPPLDARLGAPADVRERFDPPPMHRAPSGAPLLSVRDLVAGYGDAEVLRGLSLEIARGSVMAWLGENGAGKTTLARAVMGLVPTRAGSIAVDGIAFGALPVERRARHAGLVFQHPDRQLFARTVLDEALFGPRAVGMPDAAARESAREALAAVGLEGRAREHPGDLAPQHQRLVAIAAALAVRPALLMLDEPTAGQDAEGRSRIARALALQRSRGAAAVITHDRAFAGRHCDAAVTIAGGAAAAVTIVGSRAVI